MCYKSFYYNFNGFSSTDIENDTQGGYTSVKKFSGPIYDILTNQIIGNHTYIGNINKLNPCETGYAFGTGTFYFEDGNISFTITFRNNVYQYPEGLLATNITNASGEYFSSIGNPITIDVNNVTGKRTITVRL